MKLKRVVRWSGVVISLGLLVAALLAYWTSGYTCVDFAGVVESVGRNVTQFKPGDEVFGGRTGAFAEYVSVRQDRSVVLKPGNLTFEQAAPVPIAAITALQGLRDKGELQPGQKVLI